MQSKGINTSDIIIRTDDIKKSYGETHAMRGISLDIKRGEVLAIMGPSGSGKSTLLWLALPNLIAVKSTSTVRALTI